MAPTENVWICERCLTKFHQRNGIVGPYYHPCGPNKPLCRTCIEPVRRKGEIDPPVRDQLDALGIGGRRR